VCAVDAFQSVRSHISLSEDQSRTILTTRLGGNTNKLSKTDLITQLESADEGEEFHRFFELPPELRNRVYTKCFEWLGLIPPTFKQPPLLLVSRTTRREALPLLYRFAQFEIHLNGKYSPRYTGIISVHVPYMSFTLEQVSRKAVESISERAFSFITRLRIIDDTHEWIVDLRTGVVDMQVVSRYTWMNHDLRRDYYEEATKCLQDFVDTVNERYCVWTLLKMDLAGAIFKPKKLTVESDL
jgi:hypothetical protein